MRPTEICLVRHGETIWNQEARLQGGQDISLSPLGVLQARAVARRLQEEAWDAVYSSDLCRAYDTARMISQTIQPPLPHFVDPRLRERYYGSLEGLTIQEILQRYPEFRHPHEQVNIPGVEHHAQLQRRVYAAIADIIHHYRGKRVIIVSHGGTIRAFLHEIQVPTHEPIGNTAVTRLHFDGEKWSVLVVNDTSHLQNLDSLSFLSQ